jgi:hypothetical protein
MADLHLHPKDPVYMELALLSPHKQPEKFNNL